ncbi:MAG: 1,2-phenylacetyl-CoA epoxidase subunit PaaD [Pseudomonadota bacterium]
MIWEWLDGVPDPEIPVVSVVDLGIVRSVAWKGDHLDVGVTPTYSGCPATNVIARDVEATLRERGIGKLTVHTRLSPPWTTEWISDRGREKLLDYGIAPPDPRRKGPGKCPRCASGDVHLISQFGSTPCKAQWRCGNCLEPFDYFKCL